MALREAGEQEVIRLQWLALETCQFHSSDCGCHDCAVPTPVAQDTTEPTVVLINPNYPRTVRS